MATSVITSQTLSICSLDTFSIGSPPLSGIVFSALHLLIYWSSSSSLWPALADNLSVRLPALGDSVVPYVRTAIKQHRAPSFIHSFIPAISIADLPTL